ncbi:MAG: WbqC family protein [Gemmatimonadota bacterium]
MTVCLISQPRLFPGLHYLHRLLVSDVFVVLDTVQFTPRHEENRTRLKAPDGARWLTIPMLKRSREQLISDTRIDQTQHWQRKAIHTLESLYGGSPGYPEHREEIEAILEAPHETLVDVTTASWGPALRALEPDCEILRASDLHATGSGQDLLLGICREVGADSYLSGAFGREYLDEGRFEESGIHVFYHDYEYPEYQQRFGEFVPYLSYLDVLFNVGLDRSLVESGGRIPGNDQKEART